MSNVLYDNPGPVARRRARIGSLVGGLAVLGVAALVVWRLADRGHFDADKWEAFQEPGTWEEIGKGLRNTVKAAALAILLALVVGVLLAVGRLSENPLVRVPAVTVVEFFRAVPVLMLIFFFYLAYPDLGPYGALVAGLTLYNGAVLAEIFRAGILAVPSGQSEAAYSLGLRKRQVMASILVPQAVRAMLPALISQCVVVLKDTSLGFIVTYVELVRAGRLIYESYFNIIPTVIVITVIYVSMNMTLSALANLVERRTRVRTGGAPVVHAPVDTGAAV